MTSSSSRPRAAAGTPSGGQFAAVQRSEASVTLTAPRSVPATKTPAVEIPQIVETPARTSSSENPDMKMSVDFGAVKSRASGLLKRFRGR